MLDRPIGNQFKGEVQVNGDFVSHDKHTIETLIVNVFGTKASPQYDDGELQGQLAEYRRYLVETYKYLDFKGIDGIAEAVKGSSGLMLESVYVPLRARMDTPEGETWHRVGGRDWCGSKPIRQEEVDLKAIERAEAAALPFERWIRTQPALVVLGDPGSGKSTSLKRLALGLAEIQNAPLPILLPLNAYSEAYEKDPVSFEDYLPRYFASRRKQLQADKLGLLFAQALAQGKAVVLIDGLDEVGDKRGEIVCQVENFMRRWIPEGAQGNRGNRVVVTSRFVGYRDYPLRDVRWRTVALSDWNRSEIERFFKEFSLAAELAWSGGKDENGCQQRAAAELKSLLSVIQSNERIRRLAGNPLLASLLGLIKRQGVMLPHRRVELYELYMGTLLRSWNRSRSLDHQRVGPDIDYASTLPLLAKLAFHLRRNDPRGGLISLDAIRAFLHSHYEDDGYTRREADDLSKGFLDSVHRYSSLLIEKGARQYGFIHLTFEEYLAGYGLALNPQATLFEIFIELLKQPEHWKESLLLSLGVIAVVKTNQETAQLLLDRLLQTKQPDAVLLAGELLVDVGESVLRRRMAASIQKALLEQAQDEQQPISIRARAGRLLGDSGWLPDDLDAMLPIKAGSFLCGYEKKEARIDKDYWIGKYPVTNAQYRRFVEAGGYKTETFWSQEGRAWRQKDESQLPRYWEDRKWANPLSPVVGVSYYEAEAYCRWSQLQMRANPAVFGLPADQAGALICRLPSNDEWERAARGQDGREYPWLGEFSASKANSDKSWQSADNEERGTTAVNAFPQGKSPAGLFDCAGNIWEWTSSTDEDGDPFIRGGAWGYGAVNQRCAFRDWFHPVNRRLNLGFRLVLSV